MHLFELAYCCRLFPVLDGYDRATVELREATGKLVDPGNLEHHAPLFHWLRGWRCRQFVIRDEALASENLTAWWVEWSDALPDPDQTIDVLDEDALNTVADAYDDLRQRQASWQQLETGRVAKTFGPAGAAKAMYAVRPNACSPWDDPIRKHFQLGEDGSAYRRHLVRAREELTEAAGDLGNEDTIATLPAVLGRPASGLVKLVDEHDWVRYTRGVEPPDRAVVERWARWVGR